MVTPPTKDFQYFWSLLHPFLQKSLSPAKITQLSGQELNHYLHELVKETVAELHLSIPKELLPQIETQLYYEIMGLGPIEPLMNDPEITDILINGPEEIYIEKNSQLERMPISFRDERHLMNLIIRALNSDGKRIDTAQPYTDARLVDGSRINVIIEPLSTQGPVVSIRKFPHQRMKLEELQNKNFFDAHVKKILLMALHARLNIIVCGGTGSGKTTLLNALLQELPTHERLLLIEDTAELDLPHQHTVRLVTRRANLEGKGEVTQRTLLKNALRMRPDRIIIGEIRGDEVTEMFQAMSVGYDGSLCTLHSNSINEVPLRLANLAAMTGLPLTPPFVYRQMSASIHFIVQIARFHNGSRRVIQISEVGDVINDQVSFTPIYTYKQSKNQTHEIQFQPSLLSPSLVDHIHQYPKAYDIIGELVDE